MRTIAFLVVILAAVCINHSVDAILEVINQYVAENIANGMCSATAGCTKGYCWAYCGVSLSSGSWCYTTEVQAQSGDYVTCTDNEVCNPCWNCGGRCGII